MGTGAQGLCKGAAARHPLVEAAATPAAGRALAEQGRRSHNRFGGRRTRRVAARQHLDVGLVFEANRAVLQQDCFSSFVVEQRPVRHVRLGRATIVLDGLLQHSKFNDVTTADFNNACWHACGDSVSEHRSVETCRFAIPIDSRDAGVRCTSNINKRIFYGLRLNSICKQSMSTAWRCAGRAPSALF